MADDVTLSAGTGDGKIVATDEIAGARHVQLVKPVFGADGVATFTASGSGLPVSDAAGSLTVDDGGVPLSVDLDGVQANASHTRNEAFLEAFAVAGELDDAATTAATEGNVSPVRITAQRAFHANLRNASGTEVALDTVQASAATIAGAVSGTEMQVDIVAALPAGTNNIGDVDVLTLPALPAGTNNIGDVDVLTLPALPAGTNNIGDVDIVGGTVADDAADSGNPVKIGAKVKNHDNTSPGSVSAEDDRTDLTADRSRRLYVNTAHAFGFRANENHATAQTNNALQAAPGAGLALYITDLIMATDAAMNIRIVEDTAGTPATLLGPYYFAANTGVSRSFSTPVKVTANKDLGFTSSAAGNHTVTLLGFTGPAEA